MRQITKKGHTELNRKFYTLIIFGLICAVLLIVTVYLSVSTASGLRAYTAGEGYWSKAQKEAVIHLSSYILTEDLSEYESFKSVLRVNKGDKTAREELMKPEFDYQVAFDGLLAGKNHPDDIPDMIKLFRRFKTLSHFKEAIFIWENADKKILRLETFADSIRSELENNGATLAQKTMWLETLENLDHELTDLEYEFSLAVGDMARMIGNIFMWAIIFFGLIIISLGIWVTHRFYKSTNQWMNALKESQEQFSNVLSNSRDVLYKMNLKTRKYEFVSHAIKDMLGYSEKEFLEGGVQFILHIMHPDDIKKMEEVVDRYDTLDDHDFLPTVTFRLKDSKGNWKWVSNVRTLVRDENGKPEAIVGSVRDISTQKEQEDQIKKSLKEKEILLQEIHHRVKNNLSIISSLLELQKTGLSDEVKSVLSSSQSRIQSIAKVHEKLYQSTSLSEIPMDTYISEITEEIKKAYHSEEKKIDISIDAEPISMTINKAITIALILNELINNAYKHAFKDAKKGSIRISLKKTGERMELVVANNGRQIDDNIDITESGSLGMTLLNVLAKRINGTVEIETGEWTRFKINFKSVQAE